MPGASLLSPSILNAPDPAARFSHFVRILGVLYMAGGILASAVTLMPGASGYLDARWIGVLGLVSIVAGLGILSAWRWINPLHLAAMFLSASVIVTLGTHFSGVQAAGYAAMLYSWIMTLGFCVFKKRWLVVPMVLIGLGFGLVLAIDFPTALAFNNWTFTMGTILVIGAVVSLLVQNLAQLAVAESAARTEAENAKEELFLLNRDLEDRVKGKILEVERLSELRRLVSANVADALLESGTALEPHRREIAVFFIDLRGFTAFAMDTDPEEVIRVLEQFYLVLGRSFDTYGATVGAFEGDGVMAFFNDPTPVPQPAQRAVDMALDLRDAMNDVVERWQARGLDLHYGIGIAYGFATMGMVGFEGRQDYTAIGTVVNLASRLCDEARGGDILIDVKTQLAIESSHEPELLAPMQLKGFRDAVPVYRLSSRSSMLDGR